MVFLTSKRVALLAGVSLTVLTACDESLDLDFRGLADGFDTSSAASQPADRPRPDNRGVISYPNYQVVIAQRNDTVRAIAGRLNLNAEELAAYNGVDPDVPLRRDEVIALPARVSEPATGVIQPASEINVTALATDAIDRADAQSPDVVSQPLATQTAAQTGSEPIRHQVTRGETIYSLSRAYGVPVRGIAQWNGLGPDLAIREGQFLLIPVPGAVPPAAQTSIAEPGVGTETPTPPSATTPLPAEAPAIVAPTAVIATPEVPNLGADRTETASNARFRMPVQGSIIRTYARGRNEGIDISAPAGTVVRAAGEGTVAAVTSNTDGASIVVIRHTGGLLTVYVNLDELTVEKNDNVSAGQAIAKIPTGDPSFLHFEVRDGLESVDPASYLP